MTTIRIFQVDAFTNQIFSGNPAAVCPLEDWLPDEVLLSIAAENNLSETAFVNVKSSPFLIRWFTPKIEVDLCGHATLASARIMFDEFLPDGTNQVIFDSKRGELKAIKKDNLIYLDFPRDTPKHLQPAKEINEALGFAPSSLLRGKDDFLCIFDDEETIRSITPNFDRLSKIDSRGVIVSAIGTNTDFVSRFFAPQTGISEDPVTGSSHTLLIPYWAEVLDKTRLTAYQCSERGGFLNCELLQNRVLIGGSSARYMDGELQLFHG